MKYNTVSTALNAARLITLVLAVYTQRAFVFPLGAATPHPPPLKTGDIVFQNSSSSAREAIMIASGSPYTHVGIIEIDAKKRPFVIEAVGPVRSVPFDTWRRNGIEQRITVMRVKGLTEVDAMQAIARARQYIGRPYDHHYFETRDRIYCSELLHCHSVDGHGCRFLSVRVWKPEPTAESAHDLDFPAVAVDDLGTRDYTALLSARPTGSLRATPPPRLLHHIPGRALAARRCIV